MKALIICGSRKGGFTSEICESFSEGLDLHDVDSEIVFPLDMRIEHCTGCGECSKNGKCVFKDDMEIICKAFGEADILVLASPIHFSGPSSSIKTVIDRFQPLWFKKSAHPAFAAALLSGGGKTPNFNNSLSIFKSLAYTAGMKWLGQLEIPDTDNKETINIMGQSKDFGLKIGSAVKENRSDR